ncbi:MAG: hypothetical protein ABSH09_29960 [Bryobacteraceae bacterium]
MDAAGCQKLYLCGITARPPMRAISKTALGSEETVPWEHQAVPSPWPVPFEPAPSNWQR